MTLQVLVLVTVAFSAVAFIAIGVDKRRARLGRWRVREGTLHLFELLGGWPGSLLARRVFQHKTRDLRYRTIAGAIVALHLLMWAAVVYWVIMVGEGGVG